MRTYDGTEVYTFGELSDDAKQKVVYDEWESGWLGEDLYEILKEDAYNFFLPERLPNANYNGISYDLSYTQGSGALIEFGYGWEDLLGFLDDFDILDDLEAELRKDMSNLDLDLDEIKEYKEALKILRAIKSGSLTTLNIDFRFNVTGGGSRGNSSNIDWTCYADNGFSSNGEELIADKLDDLLDETDGFYDDIYDIQDEFTKFAYDTMENLEKDEERHDGQYFDENGNYICNEDELDDDGGFKVNDWEED